MHRLCLLVTVAVASVSGIAADTNEWIGADSSGGGWNVPANWSLGVPTSGQVVMLPKGRRVTVADADMLLAGNVKGVYLSTGSELTFDLSNDGDCMGWVRGEGSIIKAGGSALRLKSCAGDSTTWESYGDYYVSGMITVSGGALWLPQDTGKLYAFGHMTVEKDGLLVVANDKTTQLYSLAGAGIVSNPAPEGASGRILQIGYKGARTSPKEFSGRIVGTSLNVYGRAILTGVANELTACRVFYNTDSYDYGVLGLKKLGNKGEPSSTGVCDEIESRSSGRILYLGDGETTDKEFVYRAEHSYPTMWDAGSAGGVVFKGKWSQYLYDPKKMARLVLTGSNTTECVLSNRIDTIATDSGTQLTTYITKQGSGTWRFVDGPVRSKLLGGFGVDEGTLRFESVAETNVSCSLGMATRLAEDYYGSWNEDRAVGYAYRLGCETSTNAVFEFVGNRSCSTTTRKIAMGGDAHLRANGAAEASVSFSGVKPLASLEKTPTLTLDGTNAAGNAVSEISGDMAVCKKGSGVWRLTGNQTFTGGLDVKEGTLKVVKDPKYTWFRFTVTEVKSSDNAQWWLKELGLFDADGNAVGRGLTFDLIGTADAKATTYPAATEALAAGKVAYGKAGQYYNYAQPPNLLFDDDTPSARIATKGFGGVPTLTNSSTWVSFVMHLPDDINEVCAYDCVSTYKDKHPKSFNMEGSLDGKSWTLLSSVTNGLGDTEGKWASDNATFVPGENRKGKGFKIVGHKSFDCSIQAIGVVQGARLETEAADPIVISELKVDADAGIGSLTGVRFAEQGMIVVSAAERPTGKILPFDFSGAFDVENLKNWELQVRVGEKLLKGWSVTVDGASLKLFGPGGILVVR